MKIYLILLFLFVANCNIPVTSRQPVVETKNTLTANERKNMIEKFREPSMRVGLISTLTGENNEILNIKSTKASTYIVTQQIRREL